MSDRNRENKLMKAIIATIDQYIDKNDPMSVAQIIGCLDLVKVITIENATGD